MSYRGKEEIDTYIKAFIENYINTAKSADIVVPLPFIKGAPHHVDVYILPNNAVCVLFRYGSQSLKIEVVNEKFETVKALLNKREHQYILLFQPGKKYGLSEAINDSKYSLAKDVEKATYKAGLEALRTNIMDVQKNILGLIKTNPWLEKSLNELASKLDKAKEPVERLWDDLLKIEKEEKYAEELSLFAELERCTTDRQLMDEYVEEHIKNLIFTYIDAVKRECPEVAYPSFFKGYPFYAKVYILENGAVGVLLKYNSASPKIDILRETYENLCWALRNKEHDFFLAYAPFTRFSKDSGIDEGRRIVKRDVRLVASKLLLQNVKPSVVEEQKLIGDITRTSPWLEKTFSAIGTKISSIGQLIDVLIEEITRLERGKKYSEHELLATIINSYAGYVTPVQTSLVAPSVQPIKQYETAYITPEGIAYPEQYVQPQAPQATVLVEDINELKAKVYKFEVKIDDFEKKIDYMNRYLEQAQKQQNEKLRTMESMVGYQVQKGKSTPLTIAILSLIIAIIAIILGFEKILLLFGS
ncbi:MAG: hypothetical protein AB1779_09365 [Candidatus Thermoplasmatota archaeon]